MPSPSAHDVGKHNPSLISLPPEITAKIFAHSSSFFDVLALAATSRRFCHIWRTSVTQIYNSVAPRSIACVRDARRFLVDQQHYGLETEERQSISVENVHQMVRNANTVQKAILQFEREIVCWVRSKFTSHKLKVLNQSNKSKILMCSF